VAAKDEYNLYLYLLVMIKLRLVVLLVLVRLRIHLLLLGSELRMQKEIRSDESTRIPYYVEYSDLMFCFSSAMRADIRRVNLHWYRAKFEN
jgi:hypothetical protein